MNYKIYRFCFLQLDQFALPFCSTLSLDFDMWHCNLVELCIKSATHMCNSVLSTVTIWSYYHQCHFRYWRVYSLSLNNLSHDQYQRILTTESNNILLLKFIQTNLDLNQNCDEISDRRCSSTPQWCIFPATFPTLDDWIICRMHQF